MKFFRKRAKHLSLTETDLIRISNILELGLQGGRDWISILDWVSKSDSQERVRAYLRNFLAQLRLYPTEKVLLEEKLRSTELLGRIFFEILIQANRGSLHLSSLFKTFSEVGSSLHQMKKKEKSLLFVPRFQSFAVLLMTLAFTLGLPFFAPDLFPTFWTLKRKDLFFSGWSLILLGFFVLQWLCLRTSRCLSPRIAIPFFFYFLSIQIESGLDWVTSWYKALESVSLQEKLKRLLSRPGLRVETMHEFIEDLKSTLESPWPEILTGLLWAKTSGVGLSKFLKEASKRESESLFFQWEDETRKLTMISLLPLALLIFPGVLFLLVGPQMYELMRIL